MTPDLFGEEPAAAADPPPRYTPESAPPVRPEPARRASYEQHVRERLKLPPEWRVVEWRAVMPPGASPGRGNAIGVLVRGAIYRHRFTRGPKRGRLDFKKPEPGTEVTWTLPADEHDAWLTAWEAQEGLCHKCEGTGVVLARWEAARGTTMKPCPRCNGTGNAPATAPT